MGTWTPAQSHHRSTASTNSHAPHTASSAVIVPLRSSASTTSDARFPPRASPREEPRPVRQERVRPASFLLMQHINTSIERLNISILGHIYLIDRLIYLNIFCVSALRMCGATKPRRNQKKTEDGILKKGCRRRICVSATFVQLLTKPQPKDGKNELRVASREKSSTHIKKKRVAVKALVLTIFL
jgi:hypothetical protein